MKNVQGRCLDSREIRLDATLPRNRVTQRAIPLATHTIWPVPNTPEYTLFRNYLKLSTTPRHPPDIAEGDDNFNEAYDPEDVKRMR